jgi:hypothetical protein
VRPTSASPPRRSIYLSQATGLDLTDRDVAALEGRTEGWAAALQLAALSLRGRRDVTGFIQGFAGDDRYIVDYLVEEASAEPARIRGTADMYAGLSEIALERGDLLGAEDHLRRAQDLGEPLGLPQYPYRWRVAMARDRDPGAAGADPPRR